ncbi:hypothetical protein INR49_020122 [Caranx melampygus]|nr:hypothetical protein INR49_020122 [Caranx melampygus]
MTLEKEMDEILWMEEEGSGLGKEQLRSFGTVARSLRLQFTSGWDGPVARHELGLTSREQFVPTAAREGLSLSQSSIPKQRNVTAISAKSWTQGQGCSEDQNYTSTDRSPSSRTLHEVSDINCIFNF